MSAAIFRVMLLGLLRDRGALAMSFLVPAAFFLIFAAISASTTIDRARISLAVADEVQSEWSRRLVAELRDQSDLALVADAASGGGAVRDRVRQGAADVGLILRAEPPRPDAGETPGVAPFLVVRDPTRNIAVTLLNAHLQRALRGLARSASAAAPGPRPAARDTEAGMPMVELEEAAGVSAGLNHIAYHAGSVAVLFLLLSAVHGALSLLEETESGILERILAGPGSSRVLVNGKFLYLVAQGTVQVGVIFVIAWLVHGVDLPGHWLGWAIVTVAASATAAGMALAITTACTTRRQAQNVATVTVLILSALGGSMVPRFIMPPFLQDIGWLTPNTWALEAYTSLFWRDEPLEALIMPVGVLLAAAVAGLLVAQCLARRLRTF